MVFDTVTEASFVSPGEMLKADNVCPEISLEDRINQENQRTHLLHQQTQNAENKTIPPSERNSAWENALDIVTDKETVHAEVRGAFLFGKQLEKQIVPSKDDVSFLRNFCEKSSPELETVMNEQKLNMLSVYAIAQEFTREKYPDISGDQIARIAKSLPPQLPNETFAAYKQRIIHISVAGYTFMQTVQLQYLRKNVIDLLEIVDHLQTKILDQAPGNIIHTGTILQIAAQTLQTARESLTLAGMANIQERDKSKLTQLENEKQQPQQPVLQSATLQHTVTPTSLEELTKALVEKPRLLSRRLALLKLAGLGISTLALPTAIAIAKIRADKSTPAVSPPPDIAPVTPTQPAQSDQPVQTETPSPTPQTEIDPRRERYIQYAQRVYKETRPLHIRNGIYLKIFGTDETDVFNYAFSYDQSIFIDGIESMCRLPNVDSSYIDQLKKLIAALQYYDNDPKRPDIYNPKFPHLYNPHVLLDLDNPEVKTRSVTEVYNDDNELILNALLRAYQITNDETFLQRAQEMYRILDNSWIPDAIGGTPWKQGEGSEGRMLNTNAPMIHAAYRLYQIEMQKYNVSQEMAKQSEDEDQVKAYYSQAKAHKGLANGYVADAKRYYDWVHNNLLDKKNKVYWDNLSASDNKIVAIDTGISTISDGFMIGGGAMMYKMTGDTTYLNQAKETAEGAMRFHHLTMLMSQKSFNWDAIYFKNLRFLYAALGNGRGDQELKQKIDNLIVTYIDGDGKEVKGLIHDPSINPYFFSDIPQGWMRLSDLGGLAGVLAIAAADPKDFDKLV